LKKNKEVKRLQTVHVVQMVVWVCMTFWIWCHQIFRREKM